VGVYVGSSVFSSLALTISRLFVMTFFDKLQT
jgi:hypothetical protein